MTLKTAQAITLPAAVCGALEVAEDVDFFKFNVAAGTALTFHMVCHRLADRIHDLQTIADPILMFPVPVSGGKIEGGDRPSPPSMGFVAAAPFPATPPSRLPGYSPVRPDGDQRG